MNLYYIYYALCGRNAKYVWEANALAADRAEVG